MRQFVSFLIDNNRTEEIRSFVLKELPAASSKRDHIFAISVEELFRRKSGVHSLSLIQDLEQNKDLFSNYPYGILLQLFCEGKEERPKEIEKLFILLEKSKRSPSRSMFQTLLRYYQKHKNFEDAQKLLIYMKESGVEPMTAEYNVMIAICAAAKNSSLLYSILLNVDFKKFTPNGTTFHHLLENASDANDIDQILQKMFAFRFSYRQNTWNSLVAAYLRLGNVFMAKLTMRDCNNWSVALRNIYLKGCSTASTYPAALNAWNEIT